MAKSRGAAKIVNIPHPMNIQMPPTEEHPGGRVITLDPGVQELHEDLHDHPLLAKLVDAGNLPGDSERSQRLMQAEKDYNEEVGEAAAKLAEVRSDVAEEEREELTGVTEEWDERRAAVEGRGHVFSDPHPHPETRRAMALTGTPRPVATAGLAQKPQSLEEPKKTRESLDDESSSRKRQRMATQGDKAEKKENKT